MQSMHVQHDPAAELGPGARQPSVPSVMAMGFVRSPRTICFHHEVLVLLI